MLEVSARVFVYAFEGYTALGLAFATVFVSAGVQRLDSEARGCRVGFRLLIFAGVAAFWPMLLARWTRGVVEPPVEKNPHRISQ